MRYFCTYFDKNYLPRGLTLYDSLVRHAQPFRLFILCMDQETYQILHSVDLPFVEAISLADLEKDDDALQQAKRNRSLIEYYFTCTPSWPLYILNHFPSVDLITYLDADLFFFANPQPIFTELADESILIIEHRFSERYRHMEKSGIYNVGLLVFRNDTYGRRCLEWWRERCLEWCYDRIEDGKFADQKYLDDWPERFQRVVVLQHKGAGLAPWNIANYQLSEQFGTVRVDADPLIFYHFHHLKVATPFLFDHGLHQYDAQLNSVSKRRIYAPYIRALQNSMRCVHMIPTADIRRHSSYNSVRKLIRLMLYQYSLLVIGPFLMEIHLEPVMKSVLNARRKMFQGIVFEG